MPVPPANLPRLVPAPKPELSVKDVAIVVRLARAEIAAGVTGGQSVANIQEVLGALGRVEAWIRSQPREPSDASRPHGIPAGAVPVAAPASQERSRGHLPSREVADIGATGLESGGLADDQAGALPRVPREHAPGG